MMPKIKKIFAIFLLFIVVCSLFTMTVEAKEKTYWCNVCQKNHKGEFAGSLQQFAWEMSDTVYGGNIFDNTTNTVLQLNMSGTGTVTGIKDHNKDLQKAFQNMWKALKVPYDTIALTGKILMIILIMIQALEQTSIKNIQIEDIAKMVMKWTIGAIIIDNGYLILSLIIDLGSGIFTTAFTTPTNSTGDFAACIFNKALKYNFIEAIGSMLQNLVPWVIIQVAKVVVFIAAWSRVLELGARTVLAPLGMADMITEGAHGNGMRYLRKYFACALQGAVIIAATKVYAVVVASMGLGMITHCALTCVLIIIMLRSKDLAYQVAGV